MKEECLSSVVLEIVVLFLADEDKSGSVSREELLRVMRSLTKR